MCCVLWVVQYVLLGAWTGVLINLLGLARGVVCAYNDRPWAAAAFGWPSFWPVSWGVPLLDLGRPLLPSAGRAMMLTTAALWTRNCA